MTQPPLLDPSGIAQLREALTSAGYTSAGIASRLGPTATAAVARNDYRAALRATADGDRLATLIRLFVCGQSASPQAVSAALDPLPLGAAQLAGLVEPTDEGLRRGVDLDAYGEQQWVVADVPAAARRGQPLPGDHVLGVGGASTTLANATIRRPVDTALDLGTGCGVQALHLSEHAANITATDLSARALQFAATTAALSGHQWHLRHGDLTAPVAGSRFDLVVSNPPFVVGPGTTTHSYRDSGRSGDAIGAELAAAASGLLTDGGTMQFLANWAHVAGQNWQERVAGWFTDSDCDVWIIQREVLDPLAYVRLWSADNGTGADLLLQQEWLDWLEQQQIEAIGFGLVSAYRAGHDEPLRRVEDLRQQVDQPLGAHVQAWFDRQQWLRRQSQTDLLAERYVAAPGLQCHQRAGLGEQGWQVVDQRLALPYGLHWVEQVDSFVMSLVAGANGEVALRDQLALLSAAYDVSEGDLAGPAAEMVAHLVERALLLPSTYDPLGPEDR